MDVEVRVTFSLLRGDTKQCASNTIISRGSRGTYEFMIKLIMAQSGRTS